MWLVGCGKRYWPGHLLRPFATQRSKHSTSCSFAVLTMCMYVNYMYINFCVIGIAMIRCCSSIVAHQTKETGNEALCEEREEGWWST